MAEGQTQAQHSNDLRDTLMDVEAAVAALPPEERDEYERAQQSVIDARRSAQAVEGQEFVGRTGERQSDDACIDCDRPEIECVCEDQPRCSCGVPILVCPCKYGAPHLPGERS